jgi:hypothetical protein
LQRQNELLAARGRELQAQTDLNKAIAEFERATGNTLEANNVAVRSDTPTRQLEIQRPAPEAGASNSVFTERGTASAAAEVKANDK